MIDLRSDTVTRPTDKMREAMAQAVVGDDVYGEDPTMNQLEALAAKMVGKPKALFVPSGTMGNQICINAQTERGNELICQKDHHVFKYEVGGIAALSSVQCRTLDGTNGMYDMEQLRGAVRDKTNIHFPHTSLIVLENTHNMAGGAVVGLEHMKEVRQLADENGLKVHLDGARLFHAAIALGVDASKITENVDSVMFCLSKALASPVGSIVAGSEEFIEKARYVRKRFGGGMRQVGVLAACGLISLTDMLARLPEDHEKAKYLAEEIAGIPGLYIDSENVKTNIVIFTITDKSMPAEKLVELLKGKDILSSATDTYKIRLIPHYEITKNDLEEVVTALRTIMENR